MFAWGKNIRIVKTLILFLLVANLEYYSKDMYVFPTCHAYVGFLKNFFTRQN